MRDGLLFAADIFIDGYGGLNPTKAVNESDSFLYLKGIIEISAYLLSYSGYANPAR
jgi:hypothetical protein